jgi:hypothetical protein
VADPRKRLLRLRARGAGILAGSMAAAVGLAIVGSSVVAEAEAGPATARTSDPAADTGAVSLNYDQLGEALSAHEGQPGYGQVVVRPESGELIVYWKGTPPRDVAALIGVASDGTRVRLVAAPFSSNEIRDASKRVWDKAVELYGPGVMGSMTGTRELDGLILHTTRRINLEPLEQVAGMPLRQELGERAVLLDDPAS